MPTPKRLRNGFGGNWVVRVHGLLCWQHRRLGVFLCLPDQANHQVLSVMSASGVTLAERLSSPSSACRSPWLPRRAAFGRGANRAGGPAQWSSSVGSRSDEGTVTARRARLEAVLLIAREPLPSRKLANLANLEDGTEARTLVRELQRGYDRHGRAFQIEEVAGGYQLMTRPKFAPWLTRLTDGQNEVRLSTPGMETLAIVAYRQPVLRAEIEAIRGVACGEILRQLMDRDLLRIVGRSDELGRPFLYGTSKHFLRVFGLRSLDELPHTGPLAEPEPSALQADRQPLDFDGRGGDESPT